MDLWAGRASERRHDFDMWFVKKNCLAGVAGALEVCGLYKTDVGIFFTFSLLIPVVDAVFECGYNVFRSLCESGNCFFVLLELPPSRHCRFSERVLLEW